MKKYIWMFSVLLFWNSAKSFAQDSSKNQLYIHNDSMMMTVFLKHIQDAPVDSIQARVMRQGFYDKLNKVHTRILSWNVVMGIGQIITLKFKPQYIRQVNQVFEGGAWGGFHTEF
ncbi:MAG: hypothetical protein DI598_19550, partial [Pseudopedobacter saltans]